MAPGASPVAAAPPAPRAARRRRRPFPLLVLTGIMLFKAVLLVVALAGSVAVAELPLLKAFEIEAIGTAVRESTLALAGMLVVGVLLLVSALGLLAYKRTGWLLAMILTGVFILFDVIGYLAGIANYVWMALNIVTVFYLNQREVRESVGAYGDPLDERDRVAAEAARGGPRP